MVSNYCPKCTALRPGPECPKCKVPLEQPPAGWVEPALPDIDLIRRVALDVGYATGEHGSKARDVDLICMPWMIQAVSPDELAETVAKAVGGEITIRNDKPFGRKAYLIEIAPGVRPIDLSAMPPAPEELNPRERRMIKLIENALTELPYLPDNSTSRLYLEQATAAAHMAIIASQDTRQQLWERGRDKGRYHPLDAVDPEHEARMARVRAQAEEVRRVAEDILEGRR